MSPDLNPTENLRSEWNREVNWAGGLKSGLKKFSILTWQLYCTWTFGLAKYGLYFSWEIVKNNVRVILSFSMHKVCN